ncbi:uncharacterized protein KGF55_003440 [Candida pseudojiufengensis]|uniref:uncharacterized protein n=1 Tax=Candida pseudojiufengensis TaxID=497109 RepID=UPI0022254D76|nr:uncharacterized protein KGF55_003440 [Candida pseudojiufengensis]KAI5962364.1 hypothetical protein KGF55_003440 [Candida pseudojiufengensis]
MTDQTETPASLDVSDDESSETTLSESLPFPKIIENLRNGAKDAIETKDYFSYDTLIEIYLDDVSKYSNEEKEEIMTTLLEIFKENDTLVYEIGWDIPSLILPYVESDYQFTNGIRSSPCVYKILKIFELLAIKGNPKELLLKSCEILSNLQLNVDNDSYENTEISNKEKFFEIKIYCIVELIDSSVRKFANLYPSRILAMIITSFINLINNLDYSEITTHTVYQFVLKRCYSFVRNYHRPAIPEKSKNEYSKKELEKIIGDEDFLIRKLLTGFITNIIYMATAKHSEQLALSHFHYLQKKQNKPVQETEFDNIILQRYVELSYSFDLYLGHLFEDLVKSTRNFFQKLEEDTNDDNDTEVLFEKCVVDYQSNLYTNIVNQAVSKIHDSKLGEFILYTYKISSSHEFENPKITLTDAIQLTIKLIVPQMVQSSFVHITLQDCCIFWVWYALEQNNTESLKLELATIPKNVLITFYQTILFVIITIESTIFNYMAFTLLTKLLILSPEDIGYDFIKDSIENCPYEKVRPFLIGIYKELILKLKNPDEELNELSNISLKDAPNLPPRKESNSKSNKYYRFDEDRLHDILEWVLIAQSNAFIQNLDGSDKVNENDIKIDPTRLSTLASVLNLLVAIRKDPIFIANKEKIDRILNSVEKNIKIINETSSNQFEKNAAGMLELTVDRIKE